MKKKKDQVNYCIRGVARRSNVTMTLNKEPTQFATVKWRCDFFILNNQFVGNWSSQSQAFKKVTFLKRNDKELRALT